MTDRPASVVAGTEPVPLTRFLSPKYWPGWLALGALRLLCLLPLRAQFAMGRAIGRVVACLARRRRRIAARNIELCFPELDPDAQNRLVVRHFESLGIWIFELGLSLWASDRRILRSTRVIGIEHILDGLEAGKGVIAVSGHLSTTEISARAMAAHAPPFAAMFRPSKNPFFSEIVRRARSRSTSVLISKNALRQMIRCLSHNMPVWYAADQSFGRKNSAVIPFFGAPAMTSTAVREIARISGAKVVGYYPRRNADGSGYTIEILPVDDPFPSEDAEADMQRLTRMLEAQIRKAPEQYYWVHRRFKGRPAPFEDPYRGSPGDQPATGE